MRRSRTRWRRDGALLPVFLALSLSVLPTTATAQVMTGWSDKQQAKRLEQFARLTPGEVAKLVTTADDDLESVATLTTDPDELYAEFAALNAGGKLGGDHYVLKELSDFLMRTDLLLPPAQRAALYAVLTRIDGLTATEVVVQGRTLYGIHQADLMDLLLDPATGRSVGLWWNDGNVAMPSCGIELWSGSVVNGVGVRP